MTTGRVVAGVVGALGSLVLAGGVAAAVTEAHIDPVAALPAVCRDNPGSAGGKLPGGKKLDTALKDLGGNPKAARAAAAAAVPALGSGTTGELLLRAQALAGSGPAASGTGAGGSAAGGGGSGSGGAAGVPGAGGGGGSGGTGTGTGGGGSGGAGTSSSGKAGSSGVGAGNGGGAGGTGGRGGDSSGPAGGQGVAPVVGNGPDAAGVPQPPNPKLVPPPVVPPTKPPASKTSAGKVVGTLLILLLVAALLFGAYLLLRGRQKPEGRLPDGTGMQPAQADELAARALSQGDLDAALRWTFVSGLLRLDQVGVLPYDAARTTTECSRWVRSAHFPVLADGFDLVAYGGRHATMPDVIEARHGWNALLTDVVRRTDATPDRAVHGPLVSR